MMRYLYLLTLLLVLSLFLTANTYRVKKGDTLWDIASAYKQDPFAWTAIWKGNSHIQNPHLIYPGDSIQLASDKPAPSGDVPNADSQKPDSYAVHRNRRMETTSSTPTRQRYQSIIPDLIFKAPFVTTSLKKGTLYPGESKITYNTPTGETLLLPYSKLTIRMGARSGVKAGQIYMIYQQEGPAKTFHKKKKLGHVTRMVGLAKIKKVYDNVSEALLIDCFGPIGQKAKAAPIQVPKPILVSSYAPYPNDGISAQITYIKDNPKTVLPYSYIILDKGQTRGFRPGDGVLIFDRNPITNKATKRILGEGIVVRSGKHTSTVLTKTARPGSLNTGDIAIAVQAAQTEGS